MVQSGCPWCDHPAASGEPFSLAAAGGAYEAQLNALTNP
jgi:hypothetical protein